MVTFLVTMSLCVILSVRRYNCIKWWYTGIGGTITTSGVAQSVVLPSTVRDARAALPACRALPRS